MDEFARIRYWNHGRQSSEWKQSKGVIVDIGDDAAVVNSVNTTEDSYDQVYTMDVLIEQVHFTLSTMNEYQIGYKALAANLSDIAAMGAIPEYALIGISIPNSYSEESISLIYEGIYACANTYGVAIIGGDTSSSPNHLMIAITLIGKVKSGDAILRSGARAGDIVFLTGTAGESAAGLHYLLNQPAGKMDSRLEQQLLTAHQHPEPHLMASRLLVQTGGCHSLNDVSDGVASEANEIAHASQVNLILRESALPISESLSRYAAITKQSAMDWILYGGEDYILIGTIDSAKVGQARQLFREKQLPWYEIGYVETGSGQVYMEHGYSEYSDAKLKGNRKSLIKPKGYNHFT